MSPPISGGCPIATWCDGDGSCERRRFEIGRDNHDESGSSLLVDGSPGLVRRDELRRDRRRRNAGGCVEHPGCHPTLRREGRGPSVDVHHQLRRRELLPHQTEVELLGKHREGGRCFHDQQLRSVLRCREVRELGGSRHPLQAEGRKGSAILYESARRLRERTEVQVVQLRALDVTRAYASSLGVTRGPSSEKS